MSDVRNKYLTKPIGIINLDSPINIHPDALRSEFKDAEITEETIRVPTAKRFNFAYTPEIDVSLLLFTGKTRDGFTQFASTLSLEELSSVFSQMPGTPLLTEIKIMLEKIKDMFESWQKLDEKEESLYQQNLVEIKKRGVELLHGEQIEFRGYASKNELEQTFFVGEHAGIIKSFAGFSSILMGTYGLGTCIWLVAINSENKLIFGAHLNEATIEKYRHSIEKIFNTLHHEQCQTAVYLLGGINSDAVSKFGDMRFSKSLIYSVENYIKQRGDCYLARTFLFPKGKDPSAFMVKVDKMNPPVFFRVDTSLELQFIESAKELLAKNGLYGSPIYHRELVIVCDPAVKLQPSPSLFKDARKDQEVKYQLALPTSTKKF